MSPGNSWRRMSIISVLAYYTMGVAGLTSTLDNARSASMPSCTSSEYREFDFWVGDWDAFEVHNTRPTAHVRVDRILNDCVLRERYEDTDGLKGESFSIYDAGRKLWHQTWVTNRGQLLTIEGGLERGQMVLAGTSHTMGPSGTQVRGIWTQVSDGVREMAVISRDSGKTWHGWFDLLFRSRSRRIKEDAETVAALDEKFQAAVKVNDIATIQEILADDFVLVAGSGKTFSKPDLLEEARLRTSLYEHQEDSERTVRLWGDTAIVTAKLWVKGTREGKPIDYTLWFSDTYVRTPEGWRYIFGQASLPLRNQSRQTAPQ